MPAPVVAGVAMIAPFTVLRPPKICVSAAGRAAIAAASSETVAVAEAVPPAGTVTELGVTVVTVPSCPAFVATDRSYVIGKPLVLLIVSGSDLEKVGPAMAWLP